MRMAGGRRSRFAPEPVAAIVGELYAIQPERTMPLAPLGEPVTARKPLDCADLEADGADPTNQEEPTMDATGSIALRWFDRARLS